MSTLGDLLGASEEPCGCMGDDVEGGGECNPLQTILMVLIIVLLLVGAWFMWKQCRANGTCGSGTKASETSRPQPKKVDNRRGLQTHGSKTTQPSSSSSVPGTN